MERRLDRAEDDDLAQLALTLSVKTQFDLTQQQIGGRN
jgi:hypothetical protein